MKTIQMVTLIFMVICFSGLLIYYISGGNFARWFIIYMLSYIIATEALRLLILIFKKEGK